MKKRESKGSNRNLERKRREEKELMKESEGTQPRSKETLGESRGLIDTRYIQHCGLGRVGNDYLADLPFFSTLTAGAGAEDDSAA